MFQESLTYNPRRRRVCERRMTRGRNEMPLRRQGWNASIGEQMKNLWFRLTAVTMVCTGTFAFMWSILSGRPSSVFISLLILVTIFSFLEFATEVNK